jgi:peptidoglycan/LPS O-acetylase OafA/YrhL
MIINVLICHFYFNNFLPNGWYRVLLFGLPAVMMVYGSVASEFQSNLAFPKWIIAVGDSSYSIYLSHILVLSFLGRLWYRLGWSGPYANLFVFTTMLLASVVYGRFSYRYIERPLIRGFRQFKKAFFQAPMVSKQ